MTLRGRIAVVGAGLAGATAAWRLARAGLQPVLFERETEPGAGAACGGVMPSSLGDRLEIGALERCPVDTIRIEGGRRPFTLRFARPAFISFDRGELDRTLAVRASREGARLRTGCRVGGWNRSAGELAWSENGRTHRERFEAIVFADGPRTIARAGGIGIGRGDPEGGAIYRELEWCGSDRTLAVFTFSMPADDPGYFWVFPKANRLQVGVGRLHGARREPLRGLLDRYIAARPELAGLRTVAARGGIIPFRPARSFAIANAVVVGDAAGLVNPLTGGGLIYAAVSGEMAAAALIAADRRKGDGHEAAAVYAGRLERSIPMTWLRILRVLFTSQHERLSEGRPSFYLPLFLLYARVLPRLMGTADAIIVRGPRGIGR